VRWAKAALAASVIAWAWTRFSSSDGTRGTMTAKDLAPLARTEDISPIGERLKAIEDALSPPPKPRQTRWLAIGAHLVSALILVAVAGGLLLATSSVASERPYQYPELALLLNPYPGENDAGLEVRASLEPEIGWFTCGPVQVDATFDVPEEYLAELQRGEVVPFALGMSGDFDAPRNLRVRFDERPYTRYFDAAGEQTDREYPSKSLREDLTFVPDAVVSSGATTPTRFYGYKGEIRNWLLHRATIRVTFDVNWARSLGFGSCAISTPELIEASGAVTAARSASGIDVFHPFATESGQVDVWAPGHLFEVDGASAAQTSQSDYRSFCAKTVDSIGQAKASGSCSQLLTVDVPNRGAILTCLAVIAGALVSLALQIGWDLFKPRLREQ
jgi:hypothetical protein